MAMSRPILIVVHGEPGAGKSTLARALGQQLHVPVFDRDDFKDAMFEALGWSDREWSVRVGLASWELLGLCIERLVRSGISVIAESNFRPADPLVARLRELCSEGGAVPIEIHCTAPPEVLWDRYDSRRNTGRRHPGHVGFEERNVFLADLKARPHGRLGLGGHVIEVDTAVSWPDMGAIVAQIAKAQPGLTSPPG